VAKESELMKRVFAFVTVITLAACTSGGLGDEYELALKAYTRAAAQQGLNVDTLSALGSANLALGRLGQAERLLRRATEQDPSFPPAWNNLGVILMERGNTPEASEVFRRAFAADR